MTAPSAVRVPGRAPVWAIPLVKSTLVLLDLVIAAAAFIAAFYLRQGSSILQQGSGDGVWSSQFAPYGVLLPLVLVIRLLTLRYYDLYRLRGEFSFVDDAIAIFKAVSIGSLLIVAAAFLFRGGFQYRAFSYARAVFVVDFVLALLAFTLLRLAVRSGQGLARRRGINLIPTLVVGRGPEAATCINEMRQRPALGYRVIGVVEPGPLDAGVPESFEGVSLISDLAGLPEAIYDSGANEVIIADANVNGDVLFEVMMRVGPRAIEFRIAPSLFNCLPAKTEIDQVGALPMIRLFREPLSRESRLLKRAFDAVFSLVVSLIFLPFWLLIAVLIKLDSRGPVFYVQERIGMDGRVFRLYKFRTMQPGSDDHTHKEYQRKFIAGRTEANLGSADKPAYKLSTDPRITRVGRWLRRMSLDEVPQFLNVLRGEMSVVGPRPPIAYEVEAYQLWHRKRLDMKPGVTGLWQVSGRNRLPFEEMVKLDLFYIENWSLLLDLKILFRTVLVVFRGDGY